MKHLEIHFNRLATLAIILSAAAASAAFEFTPRHFYSTSTFSSDVFEYDAGGNYTDMLSVAAHSSDLRGIEFLGSSLYAVSSRDTGFDVLALDAGGNAQQTYSLEGATVGGNNSFGKISFGAGGSFYVGAMQGLARFQQGDVNSGQLIWTDDYVFDVVDMPSGNLLIATSSSIKEITGLGTFVRDIAGPFTDLRGLEYDPSSNSIFVTMLGDSNAQFRLLKLDGATGNLQKESTFDYGNDMFLTGDGRLLIGSRVQSPGIFNMELNQLSSFTGDPRLFVTEMPVPEPATITAIIVGVSALARRRRRHS